MYSNHFVEESGTVLVTTNAQDATETVLLILPSFFYMVASVLIISIWRSRYDKTTFLVEFIVIVIPIILNVTILSSYVTNVITITAFILGQHLIVSIIYLYISRKRDIKPLKTSNNKKDYITNCRATINLISVIAILAVDFKIFPHRFSKTLETGFSLMDVGVGLYVFANGIVAPEVRGKKDSISNSIKGSAILLIVGLLRLVLTRLTRYNVSDSEYGRHWNFFITLAFTKIFSSCILNIISVKHVFINAILISIAHETLLQLSFKKWVFNSDLRDNFIDANKEGLVSTIGYVALYLYSLYFAYMVKQAQNSYSKSSLRFLIATSLALTMTFICNHHLEVSRRLANSGYIFWILFIGIFMTWLFFIAEHGVKYLFQFKLNHFICSPYLYEAINFNGLVFFLVGNVLTGLVNLSIDTHLMDVRSSLLILVVYMFLNCSIVMFMYHKKWKLKF